LYDHFEASSKIIVAVLLSILVLALACSCNNLTSANKSHFDVEISNEIDSLSDIAWENVSIDISLFKKYGEEVLERSVSSNYLLGKCEAFQILGVYHHYKGNIDSSRTFYQLALDNRLELGDSVLICGTLMNIGSSYEKQGDFLQALEYYDQSEGYIPSSNQIRKAQVKDNIGALYTKIGNYSEGLKYNEEAVKLFEKIAPNSVDYAKCRLNRANIYELTSDYEKSLVLYNESAKIFEDNKDQLNLAKTKNNIGNTYLKLGKIDTSIQMYIEALKEYQVGEYSSEIAGVEQNIGLAYKLQGDYEMSLDYFNKSNARWSKLKNFQKEAEVLINLGSLYASFGQHNKALTSLLEAESILPVNSKLKAELYRNLFLSYSSTNQFKKAFPYQLRYNSLRDSIEIEHIQWQNLNSKYIADQNKINLLEKEKEIAVGKAEKEKVLRISLLIGLFLSILLSIISYLNWKGKRKRLIAEKKAIEKQREVEKLLKDQELKSIRNILNIQDRERKRIAQDLHDRLGSMLSMVKLHFQKTNNDIERLRLDNEQEYNKANKLLDEACNEVRKIAHNLNSGVLKNFGLVASIEELKSTLINTGGYDVELITNQFDERLPFDYEIAIDRIIREVVSNILKHAEATEISFQLLRKSDVLHISVEDNGKGFNPREISSSSGMGIKNIYSRLLPYKGEMTIDSTTGRGTSIFIEIPLNK